MAVDGVFTLGRRAWLLTCVGLAVSACKKPASDTAEQTIMGAYLAIGEVLARDEIEGVSELGATMVLACEPRQSEPGVADLIAATSRLGAADINTVRLAYRKLSRALLTFVEAAPSEREGLELVYCPMAFANEGAYWVQASGELRNPYEGTMMLRCGARVAWADYRPGAAPASEIELEGMK